MSDVWLRAILDENSTSEKTITDINVHKRPMGKSEVYARMSASVDVGKLFSVFVTKLESFHLQKEFEAEHPVTSVSSRV